MYLTPERFRTMGFGVDLTNIDDVELRSVLERASTTVDSYCCVPLLPQKFDFRGGTMVDEQHEWNATAYDKARPYRFWPWAKPVKEVTQLRIYSTPEIYVEIADSELFVNNSGGWIEVSSLKLTQYGIWGAGMVHALIGMFNPVAQATYTYGWDFPVTDEYLEPTDAYTYRAQNQWWSDADVTVKVNGSPVVSGFTLDRDEGLVRFDVAQAADAVVTASYTHTLPWQIAQATGLLAADDLGERSMRARGMTGVDSLAVGEITIRRSAPNGQRGGTQVANALSPRATTLLSTFVNRTVR